jgi:23S rRNA (cytidine2498-2'-O)-methyltransferase
MIMNKLIFTTREEFSNISKNELRRASDSITFEEWISGGVGLASTDLEFKTFSKRFKESKPIFTRHLNPVDLIIKLSFTNDDFINLTHQVKENLIPKVDPAQSFSIQSRIFDADAMKLEDYSRYNINNILSELIIEHTKAPLDVKNPSQVVSVVIVDQKAYIGLSDAVDNLSNWAGGERRFAKEEGQISRAEFKLLEAIETFNIDLTRKKTAIDLGASPGGWTRILRKYYNIRVTAVDPADLDPSLVTDKKVSHIRKTAQKFTMINDRYYDVIVNDMKIDIYDSVRVMINLSKWLKDDGLAIMTMKLPKRDIMKGIDKSLNALRDVYRLIGVRQMFHNRHEITVVLSKVL